MRLSLRSFGIALLFAGLTLAGDNTPPQLKAFSFSPSTIDTSTGSVTVSVTASATDDLSGVGSFEVGFVSPFGQRRSAQQTFAAGLLQVTPNLSVVFPKYSQTDFIPGSYWTVEYVIVRDQVGNETYLNTNALAAASFPTELTVVGTSDITPPQLTAFGFSPTTIDTSAGSVTVSLSASATDDLSGVASFQVGFLSPDGQVCRSANILASGQLQSTATGSVVFPRYSQAEIWIVESVSAYDQVGNVTSLNTSSSFARTLR